MEKPVSSREKKEKEWTPKSPEKKNIFQLIWRNKWGQTRPMRKKKNGPLNRPPKKYFSLYGETSEFKPDP